MNYKRFCYIMVILLLPFTLCSCNKNQTKKEKEEESTKDKIYCEIEQNGVPKQQENGHVLFIMKPDFEVFTEDENETIKNIDGVTETEYYGGAARTKYYYQLDKDYIFMNDDFPEFQAVDREKEEHFVRSARNITQESLEEGRLPQSENEIVLYTSDKSMLGKKIEMYFLCNDLCDSSSYKHFETGGKDSYIEKDMTITGILQDKTEQIYFSELFCDMLGKTITECMKKYAFISIYEAEEDENTAVQNHIGPNGSIRLDGPYYNELDWKGEYDYTIKAETNSAYTKIPYIDETLERCSVSLSKSFIENIEWMNRKWKEDDKCFIKIYDFLELNYYMPENWICPGADKMKNGWMEDDFSIIGYGICAHTEGFSKQEKLKQRIIPLGIRDTLSKSGIYTIAVSRELFEAMYPEKGSKVISVYVQADKEEQIKKALADQGYTEYQIQSY